MTWDLREQTLLATWARLGHEFRPMSAGVVCCLRCNTIVHVRSRALALATEGEGDWKLTDPAAIKPCKPHTKEHP
jgi:hypothetical protein